MQSALSSLHSHARNGATPQAGQGAPTPSAATPDLDPHRLRLVQLIDAVTTLHTHLSFLAFHSPSPSTLNPGLPAFSDLVARYNTLLTHLTALQGLVSSQQDRDKDRDRDRDEGEQGGALGRRRRQDRDRDLKREKWDALAVVPTDKVDESRDWIVGMLLRTKQTPDVEASQIALVKSLPEPFASALLSSSSTSSTLATTTSTSAHPAAPPSSTASPSFAALAASHARLVSLAHDRLAALKEFNSASEEWDWKARVELDDDDEEEEEEGKGGEGGGEGAERGPGGGAGGKVDAMQVDGEGAAASGSAGPRAWTPREVQAFMRTGVKPVL